MDLSGEADQVGELADGRQVADLGQPLEPDRVQIVAGQQAEVAVGPADHPRAAGLRVMEQVALADRLDHERVLAATRRRSRPRGRQVAKRRRQSGGVGDVRADDRIVGSQKAG